MIMMMFIYVCKYVGMSLSDMIMVFLCQLLCMYICILSLSDRVVRDCSCGGMISCVSEWHEEIPGS